MATRTKVRFPVLLVLFVAACAPYTGVHTTPGPGVERIPTMLAVHPLLSNRLPVQGGWRPMVELQAAESGRDVHLVPPTESELAVTPAGQLLTGELTVRLGEYGFELLELPYEPIDNDGTVAYAISLATLDELRRDHGLEAVLVGNVFCTRTGSPRQVLVEAAYLKVVDTASLEVLCQVTVPYDEYGRDVHDTADVLARELAAMAGFE